MLKATRLCRVQCLLWTLILISAFLCSQSLNAQGAVSNYSNTVTINETNATLKSIFKIITKQTKLKFLGSSSSLDLSEKHSINVKNATVDQVLYKLLKGKGLSWSIEDGTIIIKKYNEVTSSNESSKSRNNNDSLITVSGIITNEKAEPIVGATILIKNTQQGTVTSADGSFKIPGVKSNASIVITNIGYLTREISIKGKKNIGTIQLGEHIGILDETVILAYSKTTNRLLTGNVSKVSAKDIENSPVNNSILAVAGRVPGIQITQASGFAGGGVNIVIQGLNSLQRGNTPFYVIDGVPYTQALLPSLGSILKAAGTGAGDGQTYGNPLSYINPADIESIEILKDADATAIYGSRAANGAIIITTRRGEKGKMKLDVNYQNGISMVARNLALLSNTEYLSMRNEAKRNDNATISGTDYDLNGTWDSTKNTDWQKELIGGKAKYQELNVGISGGNSNIQYLFGTTYHKETTVFPTSLSDNKVSVRLNLDAVSDNQKFRFTFSGNYLFDYNKLPNTDLTQFAMILPPNTPSLLKSDGSVNWAPNKTGTSSTIRSHPFASLTSLYYNKTKNLISNATFSYNILDGLILKTSLGYTTLQTDEISTIPSTVRAPEFRPTFSPTASYGINDINSWIIEPQISYYKNIASGSLSIVAGTTIQQNNSSRKLIVGSGYASDQVLENINSATTLISPIGSTRLSTYKYNAGFFQGTFDWMKKYIINISGRRDGSSRFGSENRFHNFGAIGAAWIFSSENWIKNRIRILSYGKIRASYGTTGNDQIGDYNYLSLYQDNNPEIPYRGGASLGISTISNPYLQWEETKKRSVGIDLGFIDDKILINLNYYKNSSSNMLVTYPLPATGGPVGGLTANLPAIIQNKGLEVSLHTINYTRNSFIWRSDINLTIPQNKLKYFQNLNSSVYSESYEIDKSISILKVYRSNGVNPVTGIYDFRDKDGKVTNDPMSDLQNYNKILNPDPKFYGGISNSLSYKGFSIDFLLQFVNQIGKNSPYGSTPGLGRNNQTKSVLNRWKKVGDKSKFQRFTTSNPDVINAFNNQFPSDAYWENASFIRLKNVSVSYRLPNKWISKLKVQTCRIFINGQNLFTITKYKGLDPESLSNFTLPPLRTITFGIHASL